MNVPRYHRHTTLWTLLIKFFTSDVYRATEQLFVEITLIPELFLLHDILVIIGVLISAAFILLY